MKKKICSKCKKNKAGDTFCPYASEINGEERECDCCEECRHGCLMDI